MKPMGNEPIWLKKHQIDAQFYALSRGTIRFVGFLKRRYVLIILLFDIVPKVTFIPY